MTPEESQPVDPAGAVLGAIQRGMSATAGLRAFRQAGGRISDRTWYRLTGELQAMLARREGIYDQPLNRRPAGPEIETWSKWHGAGYIQQVEVLARDRDTGEIVSIPYSHMTRTLISRKRAIQLALQHITPEGTDGDRQQLLGAVYTGTYQGSQTEA